MITLGRFFTVSVPEKMTGGSVTSWFGRSGDIASWGFFYASVYFVVLSISFADLRMVVWYYCHYKSAFSSLMIYMHHNYSLGRGGSV